jgi:nucleotide-binding universal stress UspA family protein
MVPIRRILFPTDFSEHSDHAWTYALRFAREFSAAILLLHVVAPPPRMTESYAVQFDPEKYTQAASAEALASMDRLIRSAQGQGLTVSSEVRVGTDFAEIIDCARRSEIDLIVMATHGRTGVAHVLLGSVAEKVVRKAVCPVLTVKHPAMHFETP